MANSIYEMFTAGVDRGQQRKERRTLSDYLQSALAGDQQAQAAIYGANPDTGMKVEGLAQQRTQSASEAARKRAADLSNVMLRAPQMAAQVYPQFKQAYEGLGLGITLPDQYEEGALDLAKALVPSAEGEQYTLAPGAARYGPDGRLIAERPFAPIKPEYQLYDGADGPVWLPKPAAGPMGAGATAPPSGGAASLMGSSFDDAVAHVLKTEGGYVANDAGAGPTNFGINSRANPDVNVASLTPDGAKQVYRERYWDAIGADQLPPQIRMAAFDAAVNQGPQRALEWVRESGGDPQKFAALRQGHYNGLVQSNPEKYGQYAQGWQNRNQQTAGVTAIPVQGVRPKPKADGAPSGYQWGPDGRSLVPIPGGPADRKNNPTPEDQAKAEMGMRKEVTQLLKEPRTVISMFEKVQAAGSNPSAPNDLALIFAYMKMLDPGSVVREQEFANAQNAAGVPDQVRNAYNKALSGQRLNPDQRRAFVASAQQVADIARNEITKVTREYQGTAEQYGYDPRRAVGAPDFRNVQGGQPQPSAADPARQSLLDKYK